MRKERVFVQEPAPILDRKVLAGLRALQAPEEPDLVAELAGEFLEGAPHRLERMRQQLAAGDAPSLEFEAHGLAGNCGALGMPRLLAHCRALEDLTHGGSVEGAAPLLAEVEQSFEEARAALLLELSTALEVPYSP